MAINGVEMITDRSLSDVEYAKSLLKKGFKNMTDAERDAFLSGLKGCYNYTDFNRVEGAVEYLAERLYSLPDELQMYAQDLGVVWDWVYNVPYNPNDLYDLETKTDWVVSDILDSYDRERYIQNIYLVLDALEIDRGEIPDVMELFDHKIANLIEERLEASPPLLDKIKKEKENLISGTRNAWYYSGDIYAGEI